MAILELSQEEIEEAKRLYGSIFRIKIKDTYAYFRSINRTEAASIGIKQGALSGEQEDDLIKLAMIHPSPEELDMESIGAGIPSSIASKVLDISCLNGALRLSEKYREIKLSKTIYHDITSVICTAFPDIYPSELDNFEITALLELLMISENVLMIKQLVSTGTFDQIDFTEEEDQKDMSPEQKDRAIREMLAQQSQDMPEGWIDRTKKSPPGSSAAEPNQQI